MVNILEIFPRKPNAKKNPSCIQIQPLCTLKITDLTWVFRIRRGISKSGVVRTLTGQKIFQSPDALSSIEVASQFYSRNHSQIMQRFLTHC